MSIVRVEAREGVALLTLDRPPANAFVPELVEGLRQAFAESSRARGVLLSSALPNLFSAGWDLPTIIHFDRGEMRRFVDSYCDLVREVFAFGAPVLAALSGHAIAGGLILAAAADERYAAVGKAQFGLSEVALGVPVPACLLEVFRHAIGARAAERLAAAGENCSAQGAVSIGLADRALDAQELPGRAWERVRFLAERPARAYAAIKRRIRAEALERFDQARRGDPFLDSWFGTDAQERIAELVAKLKKSDK
jgi:enoyl-CoA hydratase